MVSHGFGESWLDAEESLVDRGRVVAVQRDHLVSRLAAANDLECVGSNPRDDRLSDRRRRLPTETEFGASSV